MYEWLAIAIPLFAVVFLFWVLRAGRKPLACPQCGAPMLNFIMTQKGSEGQAFLWVCRSVSVNIIDNYLGTSIPNWFISCKGEKTILADQDLHNDKEHCEINKQKYLFDKKDLKCPDCGTPLYKFSTLPHQNGRVATLWLCGNSKIDVIKSRASGAVQDWSITCNERAKLKTKMEHN